MKTHQSSITTTRTLPIPIPAMKKEAAPGLDAFYQVLTPPESVTVSPSDVYRDFDSNPLLNEKCDILFNYNPEYSSSANNDQISQSPPYLFDYNKNECSRSLSNSSSYNFSPDFGGWQDEFFHFTNDSFLKDCGSLEEVHEKPRQSDDAELSQIIDRASKIPSPVSVVRSSVEEIFYEIYRECEQNFVEKIQEMAVDLNISNEVEVDMDDVNLFVLETGLPDDNTSESEYDYNSSTESESTARGSPATTDGGSTKFGVDLVVKKKDQNRKAASRYRSKKKSARKHLNVERQRLEAENEKLKTAVQDYEREISYLKNFVNEIRQKIGK